MTGRDLLEKLDLAAAADAPPRRRKRRRGGIAAAACLCLLLGLWGGVRLYRSPGGDGLVGCDEYLWPGDIWPVLRVEGRLYRWAGTAKPKDYYRQDAYTVYEATTAVPPWFVEYGPIRGVTEGPPEEELQLQAGFQASGTVLIDPEAPEEVFAWITTDWWVVDRYVRFTLLEETGPVRGICPGKPDIFDGVPYTIKIVPYRVPYRHHRARMRPRGRETAWWRTA